MKTKYLLASLAIPAMFAACSQDEFVAEVQNQNDVLGTIAGDVAFTFENQVDSRMAWGASGNATWDGEEEFSMFWLGATGNNVATQNSKSVFKSQANALYKRNSESDPFSSENVVYIGNHVIVYPADKLHMSDKEIAVKVDQSQDGTQALGLRSIYTSDKLNIQAPLAPGATPVAGVIYAAGYDKPVTASVKPLTSNLVLNLNFVMSTGMTDVTVKQVNLITNNNVFATEGYLYEKSENVAVAGQTAVNKNKMAFVSNGTLVNKIGVAFAEGKKVYATDNVLTTQIALLPVDETALNSTSTYAIEVVTNYGTVTINKAQLVKNSNNIYLAETAKNVKAEQDKIAAETTATTALNLKEELALTYTYNPATYRTKAYALAESAQSYGKRITLNATVKMSEASIHNLAVTTSEELIDAYNVYDLLGKTGVENFMLVGKKENTASTYKTFELTPAALAKINAHEDITLTILNTDTLELTGAFTAVPDLNGVLKSSDGALIPTIGNEADVTLALGEGAEWTLDVKNAKIFNVWKEISVEGELTITESATTATGEQVLNKVIVNLGDVTFDGKVTMPVNYKQVAGANTVIGEDAYLTLTGAANNLAGTVDVDGKLVNKGTTVLSGNLTVAGSLMNATTYSLTNLGTVTLEGAGSAIVSENGNGSVNGSIVLAARKSQVNVTGSNKGYIKWTCDVEEFADQDDDAFNYLILNSDIEFKTKDYGKTSGKVKFIEVAGAKVSVNGDTSLTLTTVKVNAGKTMVVPVGFTVKTTNTILGGDIEVYGTYTAGTATGDGNIFYL